MQILGIGTDIVDIERIESIMQRQGERFLQRMLHASELLQFRQLPANRAAAWLAKRFATKEACAKALGTGIGQHAQLTEIETRHDAQGKPQLYLHGTTRLTAERLGVQEMALTLADERRYAVAFVILTGQQV